MKTQTKSNIEGKKLSSSSNPHINEANGIDNQQSNQEYILAFSESKYRTNYELKYEALYIANLFFIMNKTNWHSMEDEFYIISSNWFNKWKLYTNYDYYMAKTNHLLDPKVEEKEFFETSESFIIDELKKEFENSYLSANTSLYPGHISNNLLVYDSNQCLSDDKGPDYSSYHSINLKENILEENDFIIVSADIWKFLFKIYGGLEIMRYKINLSPEHSVIETKLKSMLVITTRIKGNRIDKPKYAFQSRAKTIKDFKKYLIKLSPHTQYRDDSHNSSKNYRLWCLDSSISIESFEDFFISALKKVSK